MFFITSLENSVVIKFLSDSLNCIYAVRKDFKLSLLPKCYKLSETPYKRFLKTWKLKTSDRKKLDENKTASSSIV